MIVKKEDILNMDRIERLNLINSITGIKPANLIGSISPEGATNLAIFSSVVHLGSNPALLGMVLRPRTDVKRHTYDNIQSTGFYTINHVHPSFAINAHYTSAKFDVHESEFTHCNLTEEYLQDFPAPYVKESRIKIGMQFRQSIPIEINQTMMIIGEIQQLIVPEEVVDEKGHIDLTRSEGVGISGLNSYYTLNKIAQFPYARTNELPQL